MISPFHYLLSPCHLFTFFVFLRYELKIAQLWKKSTNFLAALLSAFGFLLSAFLPLATQAQIYHEDDKEGLRNFLRQPSAQAGKINAEQLGLTLFDTTTWNANENWVSKVQYLTWNNDNPKRLTHTFSYNTYDSMLGWHSKNLAGTLDATKWIALTVLYCFGNSQLTELDVSGCNGVNTFRVWR